MKCGPAQNENRGGAAQSDSGSLAGGETPAVATTELPAGLANDIDGFIGFLDLERGLSRHTLAGYENDLRQCARFVARGGARGWAEVEPVLLSGWIYRLSEEGLAAGSLARKLAALRTFARYLVSERTVPGISRRSSSGRSWCAGSPRTLDRRRGRAIARGAGRRRRPRPAGPGDSGVLRFERPARVGTRGSDAAAARSRSRFRPRFRQGIQGTGRSGRLQSAARRFSPTSQVGRRHFVGRARAASFSSASGAPRFRGRCSGC